MPEIKFERKLMFIGLMLVVFSSISQGQNSSDFKIIDNGGVGTFKAIVLKDSMFSDYTVYRPRDLNFAASKTTLPLIIFGNGACMNTSLPFERFLTEIASFGYIVIAIGPYLDSLDFRHDSITRQYTYPGKMLEAIDITTECNNDLSSEYYSKVDLNNIAVMGQSCGGLQALAVSEDPRIKTTVCLNSAVITPTEEQKERIKDFVVGKEVLETLHSPILYIIGGPSDIAYQNALDDFSKINHVFVSLTNFDVGHEGTYKEKFGGAFASIALQWFEWQLKHKDWAGKIFFGEDCTCLYPGWTFDSKNYNTINNITDEK